VTSAETYFAAAYLVVFMLALAYVLIMALKLQRLEEVVDDLSAREARPGARDPVRARSAAASGRGNHQAVEAQTR
jgi:hypothetical protein